MEELRCWTLIARTKGWPLSVSSLASPSPSARLIFNGGPPAVRKIWNVWASGDERRKVKKVALFLFPPSPLLFNDFGPPPSLDALFAFVFYQFPFPSRDRLANFGY